MSVRPDYLFPNCGVVPNVTHCLSIVGGRDQGKRFVLSAGQGTIGRGPSNAIRLNDGEVSRVHCRYGLDDQCLKLADLGSSNGTFVNHAPIEHCEIRHGDQIRVGTTLLKYTHPGGFKDASQHENDTLSQCETPTLTSTAGVSIPVDQPELSEGLYVEPPSHDLDHDEQNDTARRMIQVSSDLNFMYHASLITSSKISRDEMLENVLSLIFEWIAADRACVLLRAQDLRTLEIKAFKSRARSQESEKLQLSQSILDYVRRKRVGILTSNAVQDQRLAGNGSIKSIGIQEAICVPIQGRSEMLGLIYIDSLIPISDYGTPRFNEDHLKLMIAIAHQIAFAIENESYFATMLEQERLAAVGQTTAALSHHIKNLLQSVNGGSHLIDEGLKSSNMEMIGAGWNMVRRNQGEVSKLLNDMLIVGNPYQPRLETADLNVSIADVMEQLFPRLKSLGIDCDWAPVNPAETLCFDPVGIQTALQNVINNSISACREVAEGRISIQLQRLDSESISILVADNGLPLPPEETSNMFSPMNMRPGQKTNGVELAVSRKLVRGHGGDIQIEQPASGGNLYSIRLPLTPPSIETASGGQKTL